jgi:hypothetical protein
MAMGMTILEWSSILVSGLLTFIAIFLGLVTFYLQGWLHKGKELVEKYSDTNLKSMGTRRPAGNESTNMERYQENIERVKRECPELSIKVMMWANVTALVCYFMVIGQTWIGSELNLGFLTNFSISIIMGSALGCILAFLWREFYGLKRQVEERLKEVTDIREKWKKMK